MAIHVRGRDVDNAYGAVELIAKPGTASPLHVHEEDEVLLVLDAS